MRSAESIVQATWDLLTPVIEANGFELIEVEFLVQRGSWILRLYIDREGGLTVEDLALLSEELGHILDVEDLVDRRYNLEVSSPGLDRPLRREKDFKKFIGETIKVTLKEPLMGRKNFKGILRVVDAGNITLEASGQMFTLELSNVKKANLIYNFDKIVHQRS
ncbi:MAG: ribosome maturation factor RimP [Desulfatiglandales bacterium]